MGKLLIVSGLIAMAVILFREWKSVRKSDKPDTEVERFRYIENLSPDELTIELIRMSAQDKEALLDVLIYKSEYTTNNRELIKYVRIFLIEEQNTY